MKRTTPDRGMLGDTRLGLLTRSTRELIAKLQPRQAQFVLEYIRDWNGAQAAIRSGYSPKTAKEQASQTLTLPHVAAAVESARRDITDASELRVAEVDAILAEIIRAKMSDYAQLLPDGDTVLAYDGNSRLQHAVKKVSTRITTKDNGDSTIRTAELELQDKGKAIALYYKRFGHFAPDKMQLGITDLIRALDAADAGGVTAPRIAAHKKSGTKERTQPEASRGRAILAGLAGKTRTSGGSE